MKKMMKKIATLALAGTIVCANAPNCFALHILDSHPYEYSSETTPDRPVAFNQAIHDIL